MNGGLMGFGGGFMWILWIVLIGVVIWAVVQAVGSGQRQPPPQPPQKTPLQILEERYARGEISREEFERMKADLGG